MSTELHNARGARVLIVEDEPAIAQTVAAYLGREGLHTRTCADGENALRIAIDWTPQLVLLDVRLPDGSGFDVLRELRRHGDTPVIMVTAMDQEADRVSGFRLGADDYVVKPFSPLELAARALAVLRRGIRQGDPVLSAGGLSIDRAARQVWPTSLGRQQSILLTRIEYELILRLALAAPRVVGRAELLLACNQASEAYDRTIDTHLYNTRRKLRSYGLGDWLTTVRGIGYCARTK